ncbi:MAG: phosphate-starvation-inducible PsiE family protein [Thermoguttaceae bacterium]|nr:phosphate-starvation-inducible PsiE family protein [Thermoguttaceae bacterium]
MEKLLRIFEKIVVSALLSLMIFTVVVSTIELGVILYQELMKPLFMLLNLEEMLEVFGFFLMVLIGLELLETIKAYFEENRVHAEVVFLVAMVAVARKVIIIDYNKFDALHLFGVAAVIVSLGAGYFLVRAALNLFGPTTREPPHGRPREM